MCGLCCDACAEQCHDSHQKLRFHFWPSHLNIRDVASAKRISQSCLFIAYSCRDKEFLCRGSTDQQ